MDQRAAATSAAATRDPVRTIAHILRATVIVLGLCALLWVLASAFVTIILAIILAVLLRGLGKLLHDYTHQVTRLSTSGSVLVVFILLVLAICGLGYWAGPRFAVEGQQLWDKVSGGLGQSLRHLRHSQRHGRSGAQVALAEPRD